LCARQTRPRAPKRRESEGDAVAESVVVAAAVVARLEQTCPFCIFEAEVVSLQEAQQVIPAVGRVAQLERLDGFGG
jgi:hypothetical protein